MENVQRTWEDWATETFVGDNYYYYKQKWEHQNPDHSFTSWNWAAFFFPFYWMVFRKMYLYSFLFLLASIFGFLFPIGIILHCLVGAYGNYLYFKTCNLRIRTASQYSNDDAITYLNKRGGTSLIGVIISIVAILMVYGFIILSVILYANYSNTNSAESQNTYDVVSENKEIIVTAPIDYKQETEKGIDLYLVDNYNDSELIFNIYHKEDFTNTVNEQYFTDLMLEKLKSSYSMHPVNNKELLTLDHQAPQTLYSTTDGTGITYFYITCEEFDEYYVLTLFTITPSEWNYTKEKIANTISSVRPNDAL